MKKHIEESKVTQILLKNLFGKLISRFIVFGFITLTLGLFISVVRSGVLYIFNIDELAHVQIAYLFTKGHSSYQSFYIIFTPIFYWFLKPLFLLRGFSFDSIYAVREVMAAIFIIRIILSVLIVRKIFGKQIAVVFIPLMLLDPFSTFSAMQIRPDNLMMVLFMAGLLLLSYSERNKVSALFSGLLLSLSVLTLIKSFPGFIIITWVLSLYTYKSKTWKGLVHFLVGSLLPWVFIIVFYFSQGILYDYFLHTVVYGFLNNLTALHSFPLSYFYSSYRQEIYGKFLSPVWLYEILLPLFSGIGVMMTIGQLYRESNKNSYLNTLKVIFLSLFIIYWIWVLVIPGIYVQYFLPLSWICAAFVSLFIKTMLDYLRNKSVLLYKGFILTLSIIFIVLSIYSVKNNLDRSKITGKENINYYENIWKVIPENESSFPNILFRPPGYPLTFGTFIGDLDKSILKHWGNVEDTLEKNKVNYVLKSDFLWKYLDESTKLYIDSNYKESTFTGVLIRSIKE